MGLALVAPDCYPSSAMLKDFVKHQIECNCILPRFRKMKPPVFHRFTVFSELGPDGGILPSFVACEFCKAIHKVTEVWKSRIISKETFAGVQRLEEVLTRVPEAIQKAVSEFELELHQYQEIAFICENNLWGRRVLLQKEELEGTLCVKHLFLISKTLWKLETHTEELEGEEHEK